jgi:hypothetical protein
VSDEQSRRRLVSLGELIAIAALAVSAFGVFIAWKSSTEDKPTRIVEQKSTVPLALRGSVKDDGEALVIAPADPAHALESLKLTITGSPAIELGGDGTLRASDVEAALRRRDKEAKDVTLKVPVRIDARYVEAGADRRGGGAYVLRYTWEGGGLFGGRSLRLVGLSR